MFKLILACLAALLIAQTNAQVVAPVAGVSPLGGVATGGIATAGVVPVARVIPVVASRQVIVGGVRPIVGGVRPVFTNGIRPAVGVRPVIGKRDAQITNTTCILSTETSKMICDGVQQLSCDLSFNFTGLGNFTFIVKELALQKVDLEVVDKVEMDKKESTIENTNIEKVESVKMIEKHIEPVFQFLAEEEIVNHKVVAAKHTFVNPRDNKPVILSLYNNEDMTDCLGFRIKDHTCWEQFEKMVDTVKPDELEFELYLSHLETLEGKTIDINKFAADNMLLEKTTATIGTEETSTLIDEETTTVVDEKTTIVEENATIVAIVKDTTTVA